MEPFASLPVEQAFWDFLLSSSKQEWGLLVYEQDWLDVEVERLVSLQVSTIIIVLVHTRIYTYVPVFGKQVCLSQCCNFILLLISIFDLHLLMYMHTHVNILMCMGK